VGVELVAQLGGLVDVGLPGLALLLLERR